MSNYNLDGKVAIVTGGGSGIGRASVQALVESGAQVIVADISEEAGNATVDSVGGSDAARFIATDVSDESSITRLIEETMKVHGRLDIAHNNAGIESFGPLLHETTVPNFERMLAVVLTGVFMGMKAQIPAMLARGGGVIVNTASTLGALATPGQASYIAAKHGVIGLTQAAALECATLGIRVNAVLPGLIRTPLTEAMAGRVPGFFDFIADLHPMKRVGRPEEVAAAVAWLASDAASFITGASIPIDGGLMAQ